MLLDIRWGELLNCVLYTFRGDMADPSTGTISDSFSTIMSPGLIDSVGTFVVLGI